MLYYLLFWAILGFIIHFYIIFGTNLLIGGPTQNCCFLPISVFRRKGISNRVETKRNQLEKLFWKESHRIDLDSTSEDTGAGHEGGGRAPCLVGPPKLHRRTPCTHIYLCIVKHPERRLFLDQKKPAEYRRWARRVPRHPRGWGARPLPRGRLGDPPDLFPTPTPLI